MSCLQIGSLYIHETKMFVKLCMLFAKLYQISVKINDILESADIYEVSTFTWNCPGILHIWGVIWSSK